MTDQVQKGIEVIRRAATDAVAQRGIAGVEVACRIEGQTRPTATLTLSSSEKSEAAHFSYEELEDSGEAIDAPAAVKVRMLVSKFVK